MVILLGDRVYKSKKPIRTEFLDFRTRAARRTACDREVELNRRLAPDVYLGVSELGDPGGGDGEPLVVMRRMPDPARLSTIVAATAPDSVPSAVHAQIDAIAEIVADFHRGADRGPTIDREGTADAVRRRWHDNIRETRQLDQSVLAADRLDRLRRAVDRYLDGRGPLFAARIAERRIVDGHADLLADDIFCLADGPRILDCLEFDDRLRYVDGLDDTACLAMDLEFLGYPELGTRLLRRYTSRIGDTAPASLEHHYIAYRAFMRAKVDCVRYLQGRDDSAQDARRHLALAESHLARGAVRLALVGGVPATGKSTVASRLADATGAVLVSSDRIRREIFADDRAARPSAGYRTGRYSPESTALVYATMLDHAMQALNHGRSVVLDASWSDETLRRHASETATRAHADLLSLRCTVPADVAAARLRERAAARRDPDSEATPAVATAMAADLDPWPGVTDIDTTGTVEHSVRIALDRWAADPD
ncbi:AAA family ATPase [Prescottella defluvii]